MTDLQKEVIHTLKYFGFFQYPPTVEEIRMFLPVKIDSATLQKKLDAFSTDKVIVKIQISSENTPRYTVGEYSIKVPPSSRLRRASRSQYDLSFLEERIKYSSEKKAKAATFIRILSWFPQIKLVGLSGSVAMMNADKEDDTDLFIITSEGRMWTARFIALVVSHLMGIRRKRNDQEVQNKICLNLFFDESDLFLPEHKHTEYGGHEVLQMKPIVDKAGTFQRFLDANKWVVKVFPNAINIINRPTLRVPPALKRRGIAAVSLFSFLSSGVEKLLKEIQLSIIKRHQTSEIITNTQLWFFPDDFEKKLHTLSDK